jgi:RimJ/RimL family protein N-acetyltransferase
MIRSIEELSFNAWPAPQTLHYDGWVLHFAEGYTRRANSVNPIYESKLPVSEKIQYCEKLYGEQSLDTVFKITTAVHPTDLDSVLQAEGYHQEAATSVQTASLQSQQFTSDNMVKISTRSTESWINDYFHLSHRDIRYLLVTRRLLQNILPATCFLSIQENNQTIAIGLGVLERGYIGLYDIITSPEHRNRGLGTRVVTQLLAWGQANGAQQAYLQVMNDNVGAQRLYAKFGFKEIYQYWYRVKPT